MDRILAALMLCVLLCIGGAWADFSGPIVPGQLLGTATNDNAAAGKVGEFPNSNIPSGSAVSLTTNVAANLTSISLSPGDWNVWCALQFQGNSSTAVNYVAGAINSTSATFPAGFPGGQESSVLEFGSAIYSLSSVVSVLVGPYRVTLNTTTTEYCVALSGFNTNTQTVYGLMLARRPR